MKNFIVLLCLSGFWTTATAQVTIPLDTSQVLKGDVGEQKNIAELNGYISPTKVLLLKDKIGLTKDQYNKIDEMISNLPVSAAVKGQEIIEAEEELGMLFQSGKINEKTLRAKLESIGKLRAGLRFVHLQVYVQVKQILSVNQWEKLKEVQAGETK